MQKYKALLLFALLAVLIGGAYAWSSRLGPPAAVSGALEPAWFLPLLLASALIDSINPCAISILFLTIAFLFSLGHVRKQILRVGGMYIFGIFLVYVLIGLGILGTLHLFNTPHFMSKVGTLILVLWGVLELLNYFFPSFPIRLKIPDAAHGQMAKFINRASMAAAFILGGLVGACEFPCTGGPYLMVLGLLHDKGQYLSGFGYLVLYNLIFVLPLLLLLLIASDREVMTKVDSWRKENSGKMRLYAGIGMILLGMLIFAL